MARYHRLPRCRLLRGRAALAVIAACGLEAAVGFGRGLAAFVAGALSGSSTGSSRRSAGALSGSSAGYLPNVRRNAELPDIKGEPDIGKEVSNLVRDTLGLNDERRITAADRITPIDRWFGWDKAILAGRDEDDPFVDSSIETSYVTVMLEKPLGIEFVENTREEGGGVMVGEVRPGLSAHASGMVRPGFHLIVADDTPVYGVPFEEAIRPIVEKEGPVKLTFFMGDAVYFYGEFRPSTAWLTEYINNLRRVDPKQLLDGQ